MLNFVLDGGVEVTFPIPQSWTIVDDGENLVKISQKTLANLSIISKQTPQQSNFDK